MAKLSNVLRSLSGGMVAFWCPGCDSAHGIRVSGEQPLWEWDGNADAPTFAPSINSQWHGQREVGFIMVEVREICHSFVRGGRIEFLGDCTHALKGQAVPLPNWPESFDDGYLTHPHAPGSGEEGSDAAK